MVLGFKFMLKFNSKSEIDGAGVGLDNGSVMQFEWLDTPARESSLQNI